MRAALPVGRGLSAEVWERRHRGIVRLLWLHVPVLVAAGVLTHRGVPHTLAEVLPVVACGVVAGRSGGSRTARAGVVTLGLIICSALLVHLSSGAIEMHFHFFVMVGVVTLYQEWVPFGLAVGFVVLHHGVAGVLEPAAVYNHPAAIRHPWLWAGIHGGFLLAASVAHVLAWRLNEDQALRDSLTRLPNRALFADRLRVAMARRTRSWSPLVVLFIDLDGFKVVNDSLGHHAGDRLLVEQGRRLAAVIRQTDTAARLGGDEFAVLLPDTTAAQGHVIAERLHAALNRPVTVDGLEFHVGASIGLVSVDGRDSREDADEVLRRADFAMYAAKAAGKGRIETYTGEAPVVRLTVSGSSA